MLKKVTSIIMGMVLGATIPFVFLVVLKQKTRFYAGNLDKYYPVDINFRDEVKDNFIIGNTLYLRGIRVVDIDFTNMFSNYSIGSFTFYNYKDSTRIINYTYSTQYYHDSCFFYLSKDTIK